MSRSNIILVISFLFGFFFLFVITGCGNSNGTGKQSHEKDILDQTPVKIILIGSDSDGTQQTIENTEIIQRIVNEINAANPLTGQAIPEEELIFSMELYFSGHKKHVWINCYRNRLIQVDGHYYYVCEGGWLDKEFKKALRQE